MIVSDLITRLKEFPQDARVVIFPEQGWSDIVSVRTVFGDFVAIMDDNDNFTQKEVNE